MDTGWMTELRSITRHVEGETRPLWVQGASAEYREARRALVDAEADLRDHAERVAALRRTLPRGPVVPAYRLAEGPIDLIADGPVATVTLTDLFDGHDELLVYHLMFHAEDDAACPMCSMWVDGLHGVAQHLARRVGFAVVANTPLDKLRAWGRHRGWRGLRRVSAYGTTFTTDLGVEDSGGGQDPGVSVFLRDGADVRHAYTQRAEFPDDRGGRGIDALSPVWSAFDLLPSGRDDWLPDNTYPGA